MLKIGINALAVRRLFGSSAETYPRYLLPELLLAAPEAQFVLFFREGLEWPLDQSVKNLRIERISVPRHPVGRVLMEHWALRRYARELDLLFCPYNMGLIGYNSPSVVYLHTHPEHQRALSFKHHLWFQFLVPGTLRSAAAVLCPTEDARRMILRTMSLSPDRVHVVRHGYASAFRAGVEPGDVEILRRLGISRPFVLYVGSVSWWKDLDTLVLAFDRVHRDLQPLQLVICGLVADQRCAHSLREIISGLDCRESIVFPGVLDENELRALYCSTAASVLASQCETFGMPAIEAMACGSPLIASDIPVLREVVGGGGLLVNTRNVEEFAASLRRVLTDSEEQRRLQLAGPTAARQYSWGRAARETLEIFRSVVSIS
ncbi:MAG TPA: glycosyltransferase family 1 protein [Terriglobales bacterium]|jgi:glycosyltransferase involved in cell wall biosynthesis